MNSPESPVFQKKRLALRPLAGRATRSASATAPSSSKGTSTTWPSCARRSTRRSPRWARRSLPEQAAKLRRLAPARHRLLRRRLRPGRAATRARCPSPSRAGFSGRASSGSSGKTDPHDVLREQGGRGASRPRIEEAPDYLTWLLEDVRPAASRDSPRRRRRGRVSSLVEILSGSSRTRSCATRSAGAWPALRQSRSTCSGTGSGRPRPPGRRPGTAERREADTGVIRERDSRGGTAALLAAPGARRRAYPSDSKAFEGRMALRMPGRPEYRATARVSATIDFRSNRSP